MIIGRDAFVMLLRALAAGAKEAKEPEEHGFMYARSFYDLDGHHWEIYWMDPNAAPPHERS